MQRTMKSQGGTTIPRGEECRRSDGLLDYEGTAALMKCSPRMVRKLVESRQLASVKVGSLVRVDPDDVAAYIERHRRPAV